MLKLDDSDLKAIASSRADQGKWFNIIFGVGFALVVLCAAYLLYISYSRPYNSAIFWCVIGLMMAWVTSYLVFFFNRKRRILKQLREEYIESSKS